MDKKHSSSLFDPVSDELYMRKSITASISSTGDKTPKLSPTTHLNFLNVRITPSVVEFNDAFEGKQFAVDILIQNVGINPATVKIGEPHSFIFQLKKPSQRAILLASGCSIKGTVSYTHHSDNIVQSSEIPMQVNGQMIYYPIVVKTATPEIRVEPRKLHFKIINLGASAKSMTLTITNNGGIRTKFEVDVGKNPLGILVSPTRGTITAKHFTKICVEMMGLKEGEFYQELWLYTPCLPIRIPVLVEVVWPQLNIIHPKGTQELALIDFQPTFVGTQRAATFTLRNFSAEVTAYVIFAEVNGEQEFLKNAKNKVEAFGMFSFGSEEGYLQPFENRVLNVLFCPKSDVKIKGWQKKEELSQTQREYLIFVRFKRVHCLEWNELAKIDINTSREQDSRTPQGTLPVNSQMHITQPREEILRLCLHGQAIKPDILVLPTSLNFGELTIGDKCNRVLKITNNSVVGVKCSFSKATNIEITPKETWLNGEKSQEFLLSLSPHSPGNFNTKLKIQIFAKSDIAFNSKKTLKVIAEYIVNCAYTAKIATSIPKPKIGFGITPLITDDVGLQKDLITFKDANKIPYAAVLGLQKGLKRKWMENETDQQNNVENAIVALPNDMPRNFVSWPKNKICRSIFTGFFRYSPPDDLSYTLSPEERIKKKQHCALWTNYISLLRNLRLEKIKLKNLKYHLDYDLSCKKSYKLALFNTDFEPLKRLKSDQNDYIIKNSLVPLSALYLIQISVSPKLINFSSVAVDTKAQELVTISNMNPFPVFLKFTSKNSTLSVIDENSFILKPMSTKHIRVLLEATTLGRYFGFLNYIINECHEFRISIFALVTPKILVIKNNYLEVGKYEPKDAFQARSVYLPVENPTQAPIKYWWKITSDSAFTAPLMHGEIPPRCVLLTEILYNLCPKKSFFSEVKFVSENGTENLLKLIQPIKKVAVSFIGGHLKMHDIPLNLVTKAKPVIQNSCYHDIIFEVLTPNPIPGVTVEPRTGIIKRRSFFALEVNLQIPVIIKFSFEISAMVHFNSKISMTISGNVVAPDIRMKPSEVSLRKICVQSFDIFSVCIENVGKTPAEVTIDLQSYPEFKISEEHAKLYLFPKKSSKILIRFEPENAARYVFYLPVILNNILGPPSAQSRETEFVSFYVSEHEEIYKSKSEIRFPKIRDMKLPCVYLNSNVTAALLRISPLNLDFSKDLNHCLEPQTIEIINVFSSVVVFCIRNDDLGEYNNSPFNLTVVSENSNIEERLKSIRVELQPKEELILKATFMPTKPGAYSIEIPIFVRGYNDGLEYNYIRMRGELPTSKIYSNNSEINFLPVPLDVGSETTLTITAENYRYNDFIRCAICNSTEDEKGMQQCITTEWLQEPQITARDRKNVFHLRIKFKCSFPIALRSYILLIDSAGNYASILVTAVADNSVTTNYAFLTAKTSNYKIMRDEPIVRKLKPEDFVLKYPIRKKDFISQEKTPKSPKKAKSSSTLIYYDDMNLSLSVTENLTNNPSSLQIDKGPRLCMQMTKSITRVSELHFFNIHKNLNLNNEKIESESTLPRFSAISTLVSTDSQTLTPKTSLKVASSGQEHVRPDSPTEESPLQYFPRTRSYVEKWIFEVVMKCEQYFLIPQSFQRVRQIKPPPKKPSNDQSSEPVTKDFIDFLEEIVGNDRNIPKRPTIHSNASEIDKISCLKNFFAEILKYLHDNGCLLPHVRPEYLLSYELYEEDMKIQKKQVDFFSWKNISNHEVKKGNSSKATVEQLVAKVTSDKEHLHPQTSSALFPRDSWKKLLEEILSGQELEGEKVEDNAEAEEISKQQLELLSDFLGKQFEYKVETLNQETFELISTQAWLDIVIQIFKVFVLKKIVPKSTNAQITVIELNDKLPLESTSLRSFQNYGKKTSENTDTESESFSSNIYSIQEKILLSWLNDHLYIQKDYLWESKDECFFKQKVINNFDRDLSDSVALLSVTASYCPYIVSTHFKDVFLKPDTPNKIQHNAGKLIEAWRILEIGLTLETSDIVRPSCVFMMMLVTHLYEVLPTFQPHSLICFTAPLNGGVTRKIAVKNESDKRIILKAKFFGEHKGFFTINEPLISLTPSTVSNINLKFNVRTIEKVSAVLFLNGCAVSPNFAKFLTFYLEGEPSEIPEREKYSFTVPLYKVTCSDVPLNPPVPDPTTYTIWYTTKQPLWMVNENDSPEVETLFKPWSEIRNRKLSRRLFLNNDEIRVQENTQPILNITAACFTHEKRFFWLLFRSQFSDFIIQVEIKPKVIDYQATLTAYYSETWTPSATCLCPTENSAKTASDCPYLTELKIPMRNQELWNALRIMFFKALLPQEKSFWNKHFEMDIGLCLILWLLRPDEEEEVLEEFIQVLPTKVNYMLQPNCDYVNIPPSVEILDVRENADLVLPFHISMEAPQKFNFNLTMTSENSKEVRNLMVYVQPFDFISNTIPPPEEGSKTINFMCQPVGEEMLPLCKKPKNKKKLKAADSKVKNREINLSS